MTTFNTSDVTPYLQDLMRNLQAQAWINKIGDMGNRPAWSWTLVTLSGDNWAIVRQIKAVGGLLLIGDVYRAFDEPKISVIDGLLFSGIKGNQAHLAGLKK